MLARISVGIAAIMVGIVALAAYVAGQRGGDGLEPTPTGEKAPAGLARFYDQTLTWSTCGGSICTWVRVPVDYEKPAGATLRLRVKLRPAASGARGKPLFVNPGGPGGSGVDFVDVFASLTSREVREKRAIVGFDPRGVGRSQPLRCLGDTSFDKVLALDPDPDDQDEIDELSDGFAKIGRACERRSGALLDHVSTQEAARDLDVLRALTGTRTLDYYGASYGTQLGATYADLFPRRTGAMILDGGVDPTLSKERQGFGQAEGFQRAFRSYVRDCLAAEQGCPLGVDQKAAQQTVLELLDSIDAKPIRTRADRKLTVSGAIYGLAYALYDPDSWDVLTTGLGRASFGDGTILLALADQYYGREADGAYRDNGPQAVYAVRCLDYPKAPDVAGVQRLIPDYVKESKIFGRTMAWTALECRRWPAKASHPQRPVSADGAAPIIVVGTTRDPATPYAWSKALAKQLSSGVLVTRKGDGHTGYGVGNACVDRAVNRYLTFGEAPRADVTCDDTSARDDTSG